MSSIATWDTIQVHLRDRRRDASPGARGRPPADRGRGIGFVATVDIARPVDDVFDYVTDFTRAPTWNYRVRSVRQITPGPVRVGPIHQVRRNDQQDYRVTAFEPRTA